MQRALIDHRSNVLAKIEGLRSLSREQLNQRWRALFASERPPRICGELLIRALAYRLQEETLVGLSGTLAACWKAGAERTPRGAGRLSHSRRD
jgi:hypothetical protein